MTLGSGNTASGADSSYTAGSTPVLTSTATAYNSYFGGEEIDHNYSVFSGYSGNFTISFGLTNVDLALINTTGSLGYSVSALNAPTLQSSSLSLTETVASVPEPRSLALAGMAFAALVSLRRKVAKR